MSTSRPAGFSVDATLGAVFIGFALACLVYGILVTQVSSYFWRYPQDRVVFKVLVIAMLILETVDQIFIGHLVYFYSITNYANPAIMVQASITWSFILQLTMGAIVGAIVKCSFGLRVWRFSERNFYITGVIMLLTFSQLGLAIAFTVKAFQLPNVFAISDLKVLGTISLGVGVLTDVVTAASLCYFLNKLRTGYSQSDSLVDNLCRYAINTGALTAAVSLTVVFLFNFLPHNNLSFTGVYFILSKLYAVSYMATLNTRRTVRGQGTDRQEAVSNNTNMFHLGTRMPSMGPVDVEPAWEHDKMPSPQAHQDGYPLDGRPTLGKHGYSY